MNDLLAEFFNTRSRNIFLFAKGRVGLYVVLKALGLKEGDEVIMPGYTCMVVPSAAGFLRCTCRYADISPQTYNINAAELDRHAGPATRALIVQHTYGIPADMDAAAGWSQKHGIPLIEDCCHAFGSRYAGRLCGTFGCASFFSGQWNKPFYTGLGGMLLVNDSSLLEGVRSLYEKATDVSPLENMRLNAQIMAYKTIVTPRTNTAVTTLYRFLSKTGIAAGSSTNEELAGTMPAGYLKRMAPCQIREGQKNLRDIRRAIDARKKNAARYSRLLADAGWPTLQEPAACESVILRYPVRVADKNHVLRQAALKRLEIGSWFEVPLHPAGTDMAGLGYSAGMCPEAEKASREVINLPTHAKITPDEANRIIGFLKQHALPA